MSKLEKLKKKAAAAGKRNNQAETKTGGGGTFEAPPEGRTPMRLLEYIEIGVQPQRAYQGQKKPDAATVRVTFELLGKAHLKEIEKDGKKRLVANKHTETLVLSLHEKAKFKKMFNAMTSAYANPKEITHMSQMIGDPFMGVVRHEVKEREGKKFTYVHLTNKDGSFQIGAPIREELDEEGNVIEVKRIKVPDLIGDPKVFLMDSPTKEDWDDLFIDGKKDVKNDDGTTSSKSKNWIQELILRSKGLKGSPLEQLLGGLDDLPEFESDDEESEDEADDLSEDDEDEAPKKVAKATPKAAAKAAPAKATKKAAVVEEDDEDLEDEEVEEEAEDEEEELEEADDEDEVEELEDDEEEEEEEVAPKKAAKKSDSKSSTQSAKAKSAPATAKSTKTAKTGATAATKSPSKDKAKAKPAKAKKSGDELDDLIDDED